MQSPPSSMSLMWELLRVSWCPRRRPAQPTQPHPVPGSMVGLSPMPGLGSGDSLALTLVTAILQGGWQGTKRQSEEPCPCAHVGDLPHLGALWASPISSSLLLLHFPHLMPAFPSLHPSRAPSSWPSSWGTFPFLGQAGTLLGSSLGGLCELGSPALYPLKARIFPT